MCYGNITHIHNAKCNVWEQRTVLSPHYMTHWVAWLEVLQNQVRTPDEAWVDADQFEPVFRWQWLYVVPGRSLSKCLALFVCVCNCEIRPVICSETVFVRITSTVNSTNWGSNDDSLDPVFFSSFQYRHCSLNGWLNEIVFVLNLKLEWTCCVHDIFATLNRWRKARRIQEVCLH